MKTAIIFLLMIISLQSFSQDRMVNVAVLNDSLKILLEENNSEKIIHMNTTNVSSSDKFLISTLFWQDEKEWNRTFKICNDGDAEIFDIPAKGNKGIFCAKLNDIVPLLQKGNTYYLWTAALPKDPKMAMVVKVPRMLVCKIVVD